MKCFDYLLGYIYPRKCLICGEIIALYDMQDGLCKDCFHNEEFISTKQCPRCARVLSNEEIKIGRCNNCIRYNYAFVGGHAAFSYPYMSRAIEHFKFDGFKTDSEFLSKLMFRFAQRDECKRIFHADIVTSVPLHIKRFKHRGYNQAELLARDFCKEAGMRYEELLMRHKNTKVQSTLSHSARAKNIKDAFKMIEGANVSDKVILIIDDVFTTGGSINECAKVLYMAGAKDVIFYTLAVA